MVRPNRPLQKATPGDLSCNDVMRNQRAGSEVQQLRCLNCRPKEAAAISGEKMNLSS
jgi:Zn finger protein HypA/HybF involved in hydrogenase expression